MKQELGIHPEAEKEMLDLSEGKRERVDYHIEKFREKGTEYRYFGLLTVDREDFEMFRIKVMEEEPVEVNQRVILDRFYGQWMIWGIEEREYAYEPSYLDTIKKRDYSRK